MKVFEGILVAATLVGSSVGIQARDVMKRTPRFARSATVVRLPELNGLAEGGGVVFASNVRPYFDQTASAYPYGVAPWRMADQVSSSTM